jgi:hypothetical protein
VFDDGVFGVERGKLLPPPFADAVGQRGENLAGLVHGFLPETKRSH